MYLIIFLFSFVFNTDEGYNVKFKDGIKSYEYDDKFYKIFWLGIDNGIDENNLLNLENFSSDIFEILRNVADETLKSREISFKEFISCCKMFVELDCLEFFTSFSNYYFLQKAYERLCNSLGDGKKNYFNDTIICESESKILLFRYKNDEDGKVFYITEPMESLYETSDIKNLEQFFTFLKKMEVREIRILYELFSEEFVDQLSKNKSITGLFIMSEKDNKVDIPFDFEKIDHIESIGLDINCDFQQLITEINKLKNLSNLKLRIEAAKIEHLKVLSNNYKLNKLDLKINKPKEGNFREVLKLKGIETLMLNGKGSFDSIEGLEEMPNLKVFKLSNIDLPQEMYDLFKLMPNLEVLDLEGTNLYNNFGESLCHLKELKELNVNDTGIDTANFNQITEITSLEILKIKNSNIEEGGWSKIANLKNLKDLEYEKNGQENSDYFTASDRVAIRKLRHLPDNEKFFKYLRHNNIIRRNFEKEDFSFEQLYDMVRDAECKPGESFTINVYEGIYGESLIINSRYFDENDWDAGTDIYYMMKDAYRDVESEYTVEIVFDD